MSGFFYLVVQAFIVVGIPLGIVVMVVRHIRESRSERREILERLARLEARIDESPPWG